MRDRALEEKTIRWCLDNSKCNSECRSKKCSLASKPVFIMKMCNTARNAAGFFYLKGYRIKPPLSPQK